MTSPFIPTCVEKHLLSLDESRLLAPDCRRRLGAVALIDASGFTALSEHFAKLGARGIESMGSVMNRFFDPIISCVLKHHGDTTKFAGDALLVVFNDDEDADFDGDDDSDIDDDNHDDESDNDELRDDNSKSILLKSELVRRACACALEVQSLCADFSVSAMGEEVKLTVHIAISYGYCYYLHLGGINGRWEFCLAGKPLAEMGKAIDKARSGETVLTSAATLALQSSPEKHGFQLNTADEKEQLSMLMRSDDAATGPDVISSSSNDAASDAVARVSDLLRERISGYVPNFLDSSKVQMATELRQVTTLFVSLPLFDFDEDEQAAFDGMQSVVEALQSELARFEGSLKQIIVDDKGAVAVIFFGLPGSSHEDNAARAVRSSLNMKQWLLQSGHSCSIGITTAPVFVGIVGNSRRCEYAAFGSGVNKSARLMGVSLKSHAAAAQPLLRIVMDRRTYREAVRRASFQVDELPAVKLKGMEKPEPIFQPLAFGGRAQSSSLIVGRERELAVIIAAAQSAMKQPSFTLTIVAAAGVGKSSLIREAERRLTSGFRVDKEDEEPKKTSDLPFLVLESGADPAETMSSFYAFRSIFFTLLLLCYRSFRENKRKKRSHRKHVGLSLRRGSDIDLDSTSAAEDSELRDEQILEVFRRAKLQSRLAPLLTAVLPSSTIPENPQTLRMSAADRKKSLISLLVDLFSFAARKLAGGGDCGLCIMLQDIHWFDVASIDLLQRLIQQQQSAAKSHVFFLLNSRPIVTDEEEDDDGEPDQSGGDGGRERVEPYIASFLRQFLPSIADQHGSSQLFHLKNMSPSDSRLLICRVLRCKCVDETIFESIFSRSHGNALYSEELAHHLLDRGLLESVGSDEDGDRQYRLKSGDAEALALPVSVQATITARLDKLPAAAANLLKFASIIGRDFSMEQVRKLLAQSHSALPTHIFEGHMKLLAKRDFISYSRRKHLGRFKHDLIVMTVYSLLPFKQRSELHHAFARQVLDHGSIELSLVSPRASRSKPDLSSGEKSDDSRQEQSVLASYHATRAITLIPEAASVDLLEFATSVTIAAVKFLSTMSDDVDGALKIGRKAWQTFLPLLCTKLQNEARDEARDDDAVGEELDAGDESTECRLVNAKRMEFALLSSLAAPSFQRFNPLESVALSDRIMELLDENDSSSRLRLDQQEGSVSGLAMAWFMTAVLSKDYVKGESLCHRIVNLGKKTNIGALTEGRHLLFTNYYIESKVSEALELMDIVMQDYSSGKTLNEMTLGHSAGSCVLNKGLKILFYCGFLRDASALLSRKELSIHALANDCVHPFSVNHALIWGNAGLLITIADVKGCSEILARCRNTVTGAFHLSMFSLFESLCRLLTCTEAKFSDSLRTDVLPTLMSSKTSLLLVNDFLHASIHALAIALDRIRTPNSAWEDENLKTAIEFAETVENLFDLSTPLYAADLSLCRAFISWWSLRRALLKISASSEECVLVVENFDRVIVWSQERGMSMYILMLLDYKLQFMREFKFSKNKISAVAAEMRNAFLALPQVDYSFDILRTIRASFDQDDAEIVAKEAADLQAGPSDRAKTWCLMKGNEETKEVEETKEEVTIAQEVSKVMNPDNERARIREEEIEKIRKEEIEKIRKEEIEKLKKKQKEEDQEKKRSSSSSFPYWLVGGAAILGAIALSGFIYYDRVRKKKR